MNTAEKRIEEKRAYLKAEKTGLSELTNEEISQFIGKIANLVQEHAPSLELDTVKMGFLNAIYKNPKIKDCEISTVIGAFYQCALYGLDPTDGECYFIPRNMKTGKKLSNGYDETVLVLNYETGYQGYLKIYEELGYSLDVHLFCEGDEITQSPKMTQDGWVYDYEPKVTPDFHNLKLAFATAIYPNGKQKSIVVQSDEIEKMRKASPSQSEWKNKRKIVSETPLLIWKDWYGEMAKKTAIRRLRKWVGKTINRNGIPLIDEGVITARQLGISTNEPELQLEEITSADDWEMNTEKAHFLWKAFGELERSKDAEKPKELIKEDYLNEIEMLTGKREVMSLNEKQYNNFLEVL